MPDQAQPSKSVRRRPRRNVRRTPRLDGRGPSPSVIFDCVSSRPSRRDRAAHGAPPNSFPGRRPRSPCSRIRAVSSNPRRRFSASNRTIARSCGFLAATLRARVGVLSLRRALRLPRTDFIAPFGVAFCRAASAIALLFSFVRSRLNRAGLSAAILAAAGAKLALPSTSSRGSRRAGGRGFPSRSARASCRRPDCEANALARQSLVREALRPRFVAVGHLCAHNQ